MSSKIILQGFDFSNFFKMFIIGLVLHEDDQGLTYVPVVEAE